MSSSSSDDVTTATQARRPWWVLLGENGAGKSSALKAIGLALATTSMDQLVERCKMDWSRLLRRGAIDGEVIVTFSNEARIHLRFDATGGRFERTSARLDAFVRGFGATRLFENDETDVNADVRLDNLYQPRIPVMDAEKWLLGMPKDDQDFNAAAATILRLLDREDEPGKKLVQRTATEVTIDGDTIPTLSDGYRSVIAMACDLMAGAGTGYSNVRNIPGFVLLDELGSHLHPRWKMRITETLRKEFPSMQFIVSTHEPLCLRGLVEGEVIGVTRSNPLPGQRWKAEFERIEQSPSRLRVDQLLTSDFFGLGTTIDPDVEELFQRYYALVRKQDPTPQDETDRDDMRARLSRYGVLGYTARDQLIYDAIDEFLADEKKTDKPTSRAARRAETVSRVANIWRAAAARHDPDAAP